MRCAVANLSLWSRDIGSVARYDKNMTTTSAPTITQLFKVADEAAGWANASSTVYPQQWVIFFNQARAAIDGQAMTATEYANLTAAVRKMRGTEGQAQFGHLA